MFVFIQHASIGSFFVSLFCMCIHKLWKIQVMAVTRSHICKNGIESLSRAYTAIYYASVFLYYWVFSTPVVSLIFGSYLYICINWLHIHFDEAFSSLRIANYKAFTRFHITRNGDLEVFTLAVDKVCSLQFLLVIPVVDLLQLLPFFPVTKSAYFRQEVVFLTQQIRKMYSKDSIKNSCFGRIEQQVALVDLYNVFFLCCFLQIGIDKDVQK